MFPFRNREKSKQQHEFPNRAFFNQWMLYMFITILEVLTDQTWTKIMTLKCYLAFIKISNLSDFQKSEWPITRMSWNSTRHYPSLENKLNENFQNIRTADSDWSPTKYFGRKCYTGHHHEKLLKVNPCSLGENNFAGLATALKHT